MWDIIENIINNHMEYNWEHQIPKKSLQLSSTLSPEFGSDFWNLNWNLLRTGTIIELLILFICGPGIKISEKEIQK
jgi:hypothetical protein